MKLTNTPTIAAVTRYVFVTGENRTALGKPTLAYPLKSKQMWMSKDRNDRMGME